MDDAVRARKALNGREILGPEVGTVRVGYAKVPPRPEDAAVRGDVLAGTARGANGSSQGNADAERAVLELYQQHQNQMRASDSNSGYDASGAAVENPFSAVARERNAVHGLVSASSSIVPSSDKGGIPLPPNMAPTASLEEQRQILRALDDGESTSDDTDGELPARPPCTYYTSIPNISDASPGRRFDSGQLREIRKSLDAVHTSQPDIDAIAMLFLQDIIELSSDYIGNTLVQKLFERCSEPVKNIMLDRLAPFLAMIGVHKNGTWAAQKIIDRCGTPEQLSMIAQHLRPYVPPLLLDAYGNYVVQCLLPFGPPTFDFIFDAMLDRTWEIAQGRFGARSMRACLESSSTTRAQQKRVALAIVLNAVPLATSPNGALLLTWLLDVSEFPGRFKLLAPRFGPHLHHLCTHKLASMTVLRIINQRVDPEVSQSLVSTLFEGAQPVFQQILNDQVHGSQFLARVLGSTAVDAVRKTAYSDDVRRILQERGLVEVPAYRRLVEEVGLSPMQRSHSHESGGTAPGAGDFHMDRLGQSPPPPNAPWAGQPRGYNQAPWQQQQSPQQRAPQRGPPPPMGVAGVYGQAPLPPWLINSSPQPAHAASVSGGFMPSAPGGPYAQGGGQVYGSGAPLYAHQNGRQPR